MKPYLTEQRRLLLDFLEKHCDRQFTVEELAREFTGRISTSAVYRNMDTLTAQGNVRRDARPGSRSFLYQYTGACCGQMHLQCTGCGRIFHMEDPSAKELLDAAAAAQGFTIDSGKTMLYGCCSRCRKTGEHT